MCWVVFVILYTAMFLTLTVRENTGKHPIGRSKNTFGHLEYLSNIVDDASHSSTARSKSSQPENYTVRHNLVEGLVDYYVTSNRPLWEHSILLPNWMKEYFTWHQQKRVFLQQFPEQWQSLRYYLVECTENYPNCGGTADRLGCLPYHVQYAAASQRLLLYYWSIPAPLESFLMPPQYGIDWRVPSWLQHHLDNMPFPTMRNRRRRRNTNVTVALHTQDLIDTLQFQKFSSLLVRAKIQLHDHGADSYNSMVFWNVSSVYTNKTTSTTTTTTKQHPSLNPAEPPFHEIFHDVWRIFFTPSPSIASKIHQQVTTLGLYPVGSYIAMHLRLLYGAIPLSDAQVRSWTRNMIHCTLRYLVPAFYNSSLSTPSQMTMPVLMIVSDSNQAIQEAVVYAKILQIPLVHRPVTTNQNPLHLEKDFQRKVNPLTTNGTVDVVNMEAFHDTFVDIYSLGLSRCVAYQAGGFGRWGSMMSYNSSCSYFLKPGQPEICPPPKNNRDKMKNGIDHNSITQRNKRFVKPLFLPPMPTERS
jgi:hypothetical protein